MIEQGSASAGTWWMVGAIIAGAVILALFLVEGGMRWKTGGRAQVVGALVAAVFGAAALVWSWWPFDDEYHYWHKVTGTVDSVAKRQVSKGDRGMQERYVFLLRELAEPFAVDDTRAALKKPGEPVALNCKRDYQFASESGWLCRWYR